jgi:predicted HicB family RNase H-like nuclease
MPDNDPNTRQDHTPPADLVLRLMRENDLSQDEAVARATEIVAASGGTLAPHGERSGQLRVRLPVELHAALAAEAARQGVSLNTLIVALLAGGVAWKQTGLT